MQCGTRSARDRITTFLLAMCMVFSLIVLPAGAIEPEKDSAGDFDGNASHGYVEKIAFQNNASSPELTGLIDFKKEIREYDVSIFDNTPRPQISLYVNQSTIDSFKERGEKLGYGLFCDGKLVSATGIKNAKTTTSLTLVCMKPSPLKMGEVRTLSVRVGALEGAGVNSVIKDYDEYIINLSFKPTIKTITLKSVVGEEQAPINFEPKFSVGECYTTREFTAQTDADTVSLALTMNNGVKGYVGIGEETPIQNNVPFIINLAEYYKQGNQGIVKIPIRLVYEAEGKIPQEENFALNIVNPALESGTDPELLKINITQDLADITCDKFSKPVFKIAVVGGQKANLTYQWYTGLDPSTTIKKIEGATEPEYVVPDSMTNHAGSMYFRCEITNTVTLDNGAIIRSVVNSKPAKLTVNLSEVSAPFIVQEVGTFADSAQGVNTGVYKTEYHSGERFDAMPIRVELPEEGVKHTVEYYINTVESFEGADLLDALITGQGQCGIYKDGKNYIVRTYVAKPNEGLPEGAYYIYCKVVATAEDGRQASTISGPVKLVYTPLVLDGFEGGGSETDPYLIKTQEDFARIRSLVNEQGNWCPGAYFKMANDITLTADWQPIGAHNPEFSYANGTRDLQCFSGTLDGGGYKLSYEKGCKPLFAYVSDAVIKNLNIYGEEINGDGLIDEYHVDYGRDGDYWTGCPNCATIENVRLLNGSKTRDSGFMEGSGSGKNNIFIRNCVVEEGVTIGYTKDKSYLGSFVGSMLNGRIDNCTSAATIYGVNGIGGLASHRGQAVGLCDIANSSFTGKIVATGDWIGGIAGQGFWEDSAPGTMPINIYNCYVDAEITGNNYIGGIFGGEPGLKGPMNPADISDNVFYGTINATRVPAEGEEPNTAAGIVSYYAGMLPELTHINDNYYYEVTGKYLPALGGYEKIQGATEEQKAEYLAKMGYAKTADEFKDGTVLNLLNESSDFKNWIQGEKHPVHSTTPVVYQITIDGEYKTEYYIGDALDFSGMRILAMYTDGRFEYVKADQATITGFDSSKRGQQNVIVKYGAATATVPVTVLKTGNEDITVYFTLLGDMVHGETGGVHTLYDNNLTTWINQTEYTVDQNATVKDVIDQAVTANHMTVSNPTGNYIEAINNGKVTLSEFSNGAKSGWMYTLNGIHTDLGIAEQYLEDQDVVVLHYTDDYTLEKDEGGSSKPDTGEDVTDEDIRKAYQDTGDKQAAKTPKTGSIGGEWLALGLARADHEMTPKFKQIYLDAVKNFINKNYQNGKLHESKSTENSRLILALTALGKDPATFVEGKNLLTGLADFDWVKQQGINGPIWALIAMDSQNYEIPDSHYLTKTTRTLLVDYILNSQEASGGWATEKDQVDTDMTAMAIQALAPYAKTNGEVKSALDKAIAKLTKMQDASTGAFKNSQDKLNAESTAQVVVALTAMGIDPNTDARFVTINNLSVMDGLMYFYDGQGQFKHEASKKTSEMATEQSYYALAAYFRFLNKQTTLYDMTDLLHTYEVKVQADRNGQVTVMPQKASEGQTVTVQVKPDTGYELGKLMIDRTEKNVDRNGKVTFIMPARDVTVTVSFKQSDRAVEQVAKVMNELRLSSYSASKENYEELRKVENAYKALTAEQKQQLKNEYPDALDNYEKQRTRFEDAREGKMERYTGKLEDTFKKYNQKEYSHENWEKLQDLYADAQNQLQDAPHADAMAQIVEGFKKAAKEIPFGADLNVTFRLIGDSKHETANKHTSYVTWVETTDYQLEAGSTVYDLFVAAMDDANLDYKGAESNYVTTIQAPDVFGGYWLGEFDNGKNSGWMYTVNGKHPDYGLKEWELEDEDEVIWHYVDDYAREENRGTWLEAKDISPEEYVERNLDEILKIGKHGDVDPDEITIKDLGKDIVFKFEPDRGYEVKSVTIDGEKKGKLKEYKYKDLSIYSRIVVEFCEEGAMDFDDVRTSDWFYEDVQYAISAGLFNGTGDTTFSPNNPMTRAMIVTVLYRLEGEPKVEDYADFIDVGRHEWYTNAVAWASENEIVNGVGNDRFAPNNHITREQMAAILYRYAEYKDYDTSDSNNLTGYSDYSQISAYALNPLKWANAENLINGRTATTLAPAGTATRAEVAAILHRFVENVVE